MLITVIFLAVAFLALANGANDNFKGVASLYGSRTCSYRTALAWATATTFAGSIAAFFLAETLLHKFSGKGLIPDTLTVSPEFMLAVALGAAGTVILATRFGFPVSTTHGLMGSLVGAGLVAAGGAVNFSALGSVFILPLLLSPLLAFALGAILYLVLHFVRVRCGITAETCACVGVEPVPASSLAQSTGSMAHTAAPAITMRVDETSACLRRYQGAVLGIQADSLLNYLHFLSAGAVSFARGLNDTPKIAALLLVLGAGQAHWGLMLVAAAMAIGGILGSGKVAETMSHKLTGMNPGQGFAANLSTSLLVTTASLHGLPVSTTHVSVGSLLGLGTLTKQAHLKPILGVLASWVITLPIAATLAALSYLVIHLLPI